MKAFIKLRYHLEGKTHDVDFELGEIDANAYTKEEHERQVERIRYSWSRPMTHDMEEINDFIAVWYRLETNEEEHLILWDKRIMINTWIPKARQKQT